MIPLFLPLETLGDSSIIAPAGGIGLFLWLLWQAAKAYKEGRQLDVTGAEKREREANEKANGLEIRLTAEIKKIQDQFDAFKKTTEEKSAARDKQDERMRRKMTRLTLNNYELMQLLAANGIAPPGFADARHPPESIDDDEDDLDDEVPA